MFTARKISTPMPLPLYLWFPRLVLDLTSKIYSHQAPSLQNMSEYDPPIKVEARYPTGNLNREINEIMFKYFPVILGLLHPVSVKEKLEYIRSYCLNIY